MDITVTTKHGNFRLTSAFIAGNYVGGKDANGKDQFVHEDNLVSVQVHGSPSLSGPWH